MWVQRTESGSSAKVVSALNHWAISLHNIYAVLFKKGKDTIQINTSITHLSTAYLREGEKPKGENKEVCLDVIKITNQQQK